MATADPQAAAILAFLDEHAPEQLRFLVGLCDRNSHTYNKPGVDAVAAAVAGAVSEWLPDHAVYPRKELGDHHLLRNHDVPESIFLVGHLDTVFPPDHPFQSCTVEGGLLRGPGTGDMKGGLAVIVYALKALGAAGLLGGLPVSLLMNADEEIGSPTSLPLLLEQRGRAAACLVAECAGPRGEIVTSRNGKLGGRIDCRGRDRHVSDGTHEKSSAILELARAVEAVEALNASLPGVSVNVGRVEGGLGPSTVPAHAHGLLDVRWVDQGHRDLLVGRIRELLARPTQPGCRSEFTVLNERPAMPKTGAAEELWSLLQGVGRGLGQEALEEHRRGTSDANFFAQAGVPTLDGFGPVCRNDHTADEHIVIGTLKERSALLALFLAEFGRKRGWIE